MHATRSDPFNTQRPVSPHAHTRRGNMPGRNPCPARLLRHFTLLAVPPPSEGATKAILSALVTGWLAGFGADLQGLDGPLVNASMEAYKR